MKAAVFYGKGDIRVENIKKPEITEEEVLVEVKACGICGMDIHIFEGAKGAAECMPPIVPGHEFSGVIAGKGLAVKDLKVGDRVVVDPNDLCGQCYFCKTGRGISANK